MQKLIARKRMTYNHRKLQAGDEFEALPLHADILILRRKAELAPTGKPPSLRDEAEALGIEVDGRWGDRRLQAEIDLARAARR